VSLADSIKTEEELDDRLSEPSADVIDAQARLEGDILLLGAGGKMGPSLARMARRASDANGSKRRIIAVSRFTNAAVEAHLQAHHVETLRCDLLDPAALESLPDAPNVVFMTGMKFGTTGQEDRTWAMNVMVPGMVCRKYRGSRLVAFSTGNVYGLTPVARGGSIESDVLRPVGEYAMSCVGRERIMEYFGRTCGTPIVLLRLNYATELRYGVLVDIARRVLAQEPIDLTMGHLNAIWQGDANAMALQAFTLGASPPTVLNVAGPEILSVRRLAEEFGSLFDRHVEFRAAESPEAILSNAQKAHRLFGYPRVSVGQMVSWIAAWLQAGGRNLGKPTHFESRDGAF
jgi:nucleoside-diphosphate-sugar epimerase